MILAFWNNIAYIVQLYGACLLFLIPARKKNYFIAKTIIIGSVYLIFVYFMNHFFILSTINLSTFLYWGLYIILCGVFVYLALDGTIGQVIYCTACACAMQHIASNSCVIYQTILGQNILVLLLLYFIVYSIFYFFYIQHLTENGKFVYHKNTLVPIVSIVVLVWILSILESGILLSNQNAIKYHVIYRLIDTFCCIYILWVQLNQKNNKLLSAELLMVNNLLYQQKKQYEITSETIQNINRKCHDLKHQIHIFKSVGQPNQSEEFFNTLEDDIMIYDTITRTGNEALDIVLMEKGLFCKNHNIQFTCMANGAQLHFIKNEDIYTLFGNALDNAIQAVLNVQEIEKRSISIKMISQSHILTIQIQNYYAGNLIFTADGLPKSTQADQSIHGYGMKSIQYTAEKYSGAITIYTENNIFMLQILIPIPDVNDVDEIVR